MVTHVALTGPPGVGKTTLVQKIHSNTKDGKKCYGFITREKRDGEGQRCGFELQCVQSGAISCLASVYGNKTQPKVGRYFVDVQNVGEFSRNLEKNINGSKLVTS